MTFNATPVAATEPGSLSMVFRQPDPQTIADGLSVDMVWHERWDSGGVADWLTPVDSNDTYLGVAAVKACTVAVTVACSFSSFSATNPGPAQLELLVDTVTVGVGAFLKPNTGMLNYHAAVTLAAGEQMTFRVTNGFDTYADIFDQFLHVEVISDAEPMAPQSSGST